MQRTHRKVRIISWMVADNPYVMSIRVIAIWYLTHVWPEKGISLGSRPDTFVHLQKDQCVICYCFYNCHLLDCCCNTQKCCCFSWFWSSRGDRLWNTVIREGFIMPIYVLTELCRVLLQKSQLSYPRKKPAFNGSRTLTTVFTKACHWILWWAKWNHFATFKPIF